MVDDFEGLTDSKQLPRIQPQALGQALALAWGRKELPVPVPVQLRVWLLEQGGVKVMMRFPLSMAALQWHDSVMVLHGKNVWERVADLVVSNAAAQMQMTLTRELVWNLAQVLMREMGELKEELDRELDRDLEEKLVPYLARKLAWDIERLVPKRELEWNWELAPELGRVIHDKNTVMGMEEDMWSPAG
ncbi:hypothetical protein FRC00_012058 [Tulasnella sp. 408]|nr:hypothetical protein FRC00_012058 [Tulasnella sp. 408]